jgi:hypothetical protein
MDIELKWNHNNYAVPAENLAELEKCLDAIFPWEKIVQRPTMIGYKLREDRRDAMVFFQPVEAAGKFARAIARLREIDPELDEAVRGLETVSPELNDHNGMMLPSVAEFEARVAHVRRVAAEHPEWDIHVVDVFRPGQPNAITPDLCQAWVRVGLLGPVRNTFELQVATGT